MGNEARILLIGTADTKADELLYLKSCIGKVGGTALIMDVGVLGEPPFAPEYSKQRLPENNIIISPSLVITADHVATIVAALDVGLTAAAKA